MLARAVSAPSQYSSPGILRYGGYSFDNEGNSPTSVSFAPLPVPDPDSSSRRHKYKMGVQGRTGILNRQRQHRNGINYRPPPGGGMMMLSSTAAAAERRKTYTVDSQASSSEDVAISSSNSDAFHASQGSLSLRRAASEDGISNTVATGQKGASGLRFWKKAFHPTSKRPVLSTIPSVNTILPFDMDKGDNKSEPSTNLERPGDADTAAESDSVRAVLEHSSLLEGPSFHDSQTSPPVSKDCPPTDAASSMAPHVLEGDVDEYRRGRSETANI